MGLNFLAAVATGLAVLLFAMYLRRRRWWRPADARVRKLAERPATERRGLSWKEIRRRGPSSLPLLRDALWESAWAAKMTRDIEQAGLRLRVGEYVIARCALAAAGFAALMVLGRGGGVGFVLGLVGAGAGFMAPAVLLSSMRRRRLAQVSKQMPEAVVLLANSLRAGFALQHGIDVVTKEMQPPITEEFKRLIADMNVGASIEDALQGLLERVNTEEVNLVVTAVLIQRTSGGNLAEILETVGEAMRERERLTGEVRTMTAQQRFSGLVLTFWPLLLLAVFSAFNWGQTSVLFTTKIGVTLLAIGAGLQVMGYLTIRRILDIEV